MRWILYLLAAIAFLGPVLFWIYLSAMACAFVTNSSGCGVDLSDFWDEEFAMIAAVPWALAAVLVWIAQRYGARQA